MEEGSTSIHLCADIFFFTAYYKKIFHSISNIFGNTSTQISQKSKSRCSQFQCLSSFASFSMKTPSVSTQRGVLLQDYILLQDTFHLKGFFTFKRKKTKLQGQQINASPITNYIISIILYILYYGVYTYTIIY